MAKSVNFENDAKTATSTRVVRRITLYNLLMLLALFSLFIVLTNVVIMKNTYDRVDEVMTRQLSGFNEAQQRPDQQYRRLSTGLLPIVYFRYAETGEYVNPHPSDYLVPEDADVILSRNPALGASTLRVGDTYYRVLHVAYDEPMYFYYQSGVTPVEETISLYDVTDEEHTLQDIRLVSLVSVLVSLVSFALLGYYVARRSLKPIEQAWEKQRRFAADTSHELRNPLLAIRVSAEHMLQAPDSTVLDQAPQISSILDNANHMSNMLSTLLTLARADADEDEIMHERIDLSSLVVRTSEQFKQIAALRDLSLDFTVEPSLTLVGDEMRVRELLHVLIDNAVRYTRPGGRIDVKLVEGKRFLKLQVIDTGIGVAPEDLEAIFDRFHRTEESREIYPEGTGLGLPMVQWITERHHAVFNFESEPGVGTTATVKFRKT